MSKEVTIGTKNFGRTTQESFPGAVFLSLLPLLFFFKRLSKITKIILFYLGTCLFFWILVGKIALRYFVPTFPVVSIVASYYTLKIKIDDWFKRALSLAVILMCVSNLLFLLQMQKFSRDPLPVFLGLQSKEKYLSTQRPTYPCPYYPALHWANTNLPVNARILFLGETRGAFSRRRFLTHGVGNYVPIVEFARQANDGNQLYKKLKEEKITHILLNIPEARRLAGYDIFYWEGEDLKVFLEFWNKYVKEIYKDIADISLPERGIYSMKKQVPQWWQQYHMDPRNYVYLYEILSPEEVEKPHPAPLNFFLMPELYPGHRWERIKKYFNLS